MYYVVYNIYKLPTMMKIYVAIAQFREIQLKLLSTFEFLFLNSDIFEYMILISQF